MVYKIGKVKERLEELSHGPTGYAGAVAKEALDFIEKLEETNRLLCRELDEAQKAYERLKDG